ncbi:hypothetical protein RJ641_004208, partial [Dillenia turbinata]
AKRYTSPFFSQIEYSLSLKKCKSYQKPKNYLGFYLPNSSFTPLNLCLQSMSNSNNEHGLNTHSSQLPSKRGRFNRLRLLLQLLQCIDKMLKSVKETRSMPPNAWLWSLIEKCSNSEDIKLLFDILQHHRRFRLSNLRIHDNFNCNLCREVTCACVRVGALDHGKKALWKHNVYGLTPTLHAKEQNDSKLMVQVMKLLKKNHLPLQPGTADIVFSICYNTDNWELMTKYSKKFVRAGVKLRQTSFDLWMDFAAKIGDTESLWKIEKLRSELMKQHTLATGFSCAKGFLLERKPESAAAIIQVLYETLSDAKREGITDELRKLVLATALKTDLFLMVTGPTELGLQMRVNLEDLNAESVPS